MPHRVLTSRLSPWCVTWQERRAVPSARMVSAVKPLGGSELAEVLQFLCDSAVAFDRLCC